MRFQILTILFFIISGTIYCQDSVKVAINVTNKFENDSWFDSLVSLDKKHQLKSIEKRLKVDATNLTTDTTTSIPYIPNQQIKIDFYCRPLFKINGQDVFINNSNQADKLVSIIRDTNFTKVEILTADKSKEKYGKWGLCGVILLDTKDKKITDRLAEIGR